MASILAILRDFLDLFCWWRKKTESPSNQYEKAKEQNAQIIESHDADAINARVDDLTDRLPVDPKSGGN